MIQKIWPTILLVCVLSIGTFYMYRHYSQQYAIGQQQPGSNVMGGSAADQQDIHSAANLEAELKLADSTMMPTHFVLTQAGYQFAVNKIGWQRNGHVDVALRLDCTLHRIGNTPLQDTYRNLDICATPSTFDGITKNTSKLIYPLSGAFKNEFVFDIDSIDPRQKVVHIDFSGMLPTPTSRHPQSWQAGLPYFLRGGIDVKLATLPKPGSQSRITKQSSLTVAGTTYTYQHFEAGPRFNRGNLIWIKSSDPNTTYSAAIRNEPSNSPTANISYESQLANVYWHLDGTPVGPGESGGYFDQNLPMPTPRNTAMICGKNVSDSLLYKDVPVPDGGNTVEVDSAARTRGGSEVVLEELANRDMYDTDSGSSPVPAGQTSLQLVFSATVTAGETVTIPRILVDGLQVTPVAEPMYSHTWLTGSQTSGKELFTTNLVLPASPKKRLNLIVSWADSCPAIVPSIVLGTDGVLSAGH